MTPCKGCVEPIDFSDPIQEIRSNHCDECGGYWHDTCAGDGWEYRNYPGSPLGWNQCPDCALREAHGCELCGATNCNGYCYG